MLISIKRVAPTPFDRQSLHFVWI